MEFSFYRNIKGKLKKRGLPFKKPGQEDAPNQLVNLAKQIDNDDQLSSELGKLTLSNYKGNLSSGQLGELLMVARTLFKAQNKLVPDEEHTRLIVHVYSEALLICDRSFIRPIKLELGRFYESRQMYSEAAECYKQSMCINLCVQNLILDKKYRNALDELKNCPSHLMSSREYTSMFLLQLLLDEDLDELKRCSLQHLASISRTSTSRGLIPLNDHLYDLSGLLESLLIVKQDRKIFQDQDERRTKYEKIMSLIVDRLSAYLDPAQVQLLHMIVSETTPASIYANNQKEDNGETNSNVLVEDQSASPSVKDCKSSVLIFD
jgi:hypothetical protein